MSDIDWCHVKQTISMLCLSIAQIKISMDEGESSVETLTHSFIDLVKDIKGVLEEHKEDLKKYNINILDEKIDLLTKDICTRVNDGIVAFQFYDRMTQRLSHVAEGLREVNNIIDDNEARNEVMKWKELQSKIRSNYTMEAERLMFDAILEGNSVEKAVQQYKENNLDRPEEGQIDLF